MEEKSFSFEHEALEADMKLLAQEIVRHKEAPEARKLGDQELLKKAIQTMPHTVAAKKTDSQKKASPLPAYVQDMPAEVRLEVEYLMDFAYHHGIGRAVAESKKSPDFIRDAFHDVLVKLLYPEMKKRGIL